MLLLTVGLSEYAFGQDEAACDNSVVVEPGDTLAIIAKRSLGRYSDYPKIVAATNAAHRADDSFAQIDNPDRIKPGWKLCITAAGVSEPSVVIQTLPTGENVTHITFLQINDVYEMTPVGGEGGVARLATLRKQLEAQNPNTYTILSGDLFSPSALGTAKVDGERLAGKQMVDAMNAFGLDFATLGNHEFDIKEDQFRQRMEETETNWFSANVFEANGERFPGISKNISFSIRDSQNRDVTIGMFGLTLDSNPVSYVSYTDPFEAAAEQINALKDFSDILVAVTHLPMEQDMKLAERFPEIDLVVGGHEHENALKRVGANNTPITKADANARTAYVIDLAYDHGTGKVTVNPTLKRINESIADDPEVAGVVNQWLDKAFAGFRKQGFEPTKKVTIVTDALDGTEASVRTRSTKLTQLITDGMLKAAPGTQIAIFNGGSIRIDDTILPGPVTEYDVIRVLPFGGDIMSVDMSGELLAKVLDQGEKNTGIGGYLQTAGVSRQADQWMVNGAPLDASGSYSVAISDFLLSGKEQNLDYLTTDNPGVTVKDTHGDQRKALITELQAQYGVN